MKYNKILLVAVNSQYVHGMLAPYYIKANTKARNVEIYQCNINMPTEKVVDYILNSGADIVSFSTYVFNITFVNSLAEELKKHDITVVYGGVEAESNIEDCLNYCDYLLVGDGEVVFDMLLNSDGSERVLKADKQADLTVINSPYSEEYFQHMAGKIAYFEASRGCPFRCSYCMSSETKLALSSIERVKSDLEKFQHRDIRVLKFVDRTFNAKRSYSNAILRYCLENQDNYDYQIHFEIAPELIDDEMIEILSQVRPNFIRMEIGMQSLNADTLKKINRPFNVALLKEKINSVCSLKNIECHVDIIAGLPYEDMDSLEQTFNGLFAMHPSEVQLGMLKMLPNSPLTRENIDGYYYMSEPPYQIISSPLLDEKQVNDILDTEQIVNKLSNSGRFKRTMDYIMQDTVSPFEFFKSFAISIENIQKLSLFELYGELLNFAISRGFNRDILIDLMRFDFAFVNNSRALPPSLFKKYNKKYRNKLDKSRYYIMPIFTDIFNDYSSKEIVITFDYNSFDYLNGGYKYEVNAVEVE